MAVRQDYPATEQIRDAFERSARSGASRRARDERKADADRFLKILPRLRAWALERKVEDDRIRGLHTVVRGPKTTERHLRDTATVRSAVKQAKRLLAEVLPLAIAQLECFDAEIVGSDPVKDYQAVCERLDAIADLLDNREVFVRVMRLPPLRAGRPKNLYELELIDSIAIFFHDQGLPLTSTKSGLFESVVRAVLTGGTEPLKHERLMRTIREVRAMPPERVAKYKKEIAALLKRTS